MHVHVISAASVPAIDIVPSDMSKTQAVPVKDKYTKRKGTRVHEVNLKTDKDVNRGADHQLLRTSSVVCTLITVQN
jgi:hypothetical protein